MNVVVTKSYDESCAYVADMICKLVNEKPDCKLGLATGGTPVPMYKKLIEANKAGKVDFSRVRTVNLGRILRHPPPPTTRATATS